MGRWKISTFCFPVMPPQANWAGLNSSFHLLCSERGDPWAGLHFPWVGAVGVPGGHTF